MRKFEVEMDIHFTKTVHVEAPDEDAAVTLAETMLMCSDALPLTDEDLVGLVTTATEQGDRHDRESDDDERFCCGDCTACGICDEDDDDFDEDEEERIDELLHQLMEALEDATDVMGNALAIADELKEITGADIFSQIMK